MKKGKAAAHGRHARRPAPREASWSQEPTPLEENGRWSGRLRLTMFVVLLGAVMLYLDSSVVHVALRSLSTGLHMSLSTTQWIVSAYMLAFAAAVPTSTWAAQRFGPEQMYLTAMGVFTVASALCGLSEAPWQLIGVRAVQGVGAGLISSVSRIMLVTAAGPHRLPRAMAAFSIPVMLVAVLGPLAGGGLLAYEGWRSIFFINVPLGIVATLLARRLVEPRPPRPTASLDVIGLLLVSPGLASLTFALTQAGHAGKLGCPAVVVPLCAGTVLITAFIVWSLQGESPLLDLRLYRNGVFRAAAQSMLVTGAVVFGGTILLPLYLQTVRGDDPWRTGLLIAPQGLGTAAAMWLSGRLFERLGSATVLVGSGAVLLATLPFAFLTTTTPYWWLITATVLRGVGVGLAHTQAMTAAYQSLSPTHIGQASTQFNTLEHVGGSLGSATLVLLLARMPYTYSPAPISRAHAVDLAYWALIGVSGCSMLPAAALVAAQRRSHRPVPAVSPH
ncbi:DHA2 family efflux MFS transporter permease subunit [Streptantibioticus ferralitis]|uniref:DHA2 family efflux MFS transporter permease subunit n=1 Tax=Streptantibioticus ferralitis TaxID=236510 RepID=A0ABT5YYF2_9ACTN|nr:DHA2 family efflux MFS transporter permease subunit [Streptantibioticus ferralitis]MDF2256628.1 DHA2 family efflux MFS transporter permease subunit [Streptantibioticus ferralitis]